MDAKQKAGFSHITVGSDDEDEVIVAGVADLVEPAAAPAPALSPEPAAAPEPVPSPEPEPAAAPEPVPSPEPEPVPAREPAPAQPTRPAAPKDAYHETTLEDLETAPMPLIQKIVLVCAVVLIVVCVGYYFGVIAH